ncbi:cytochrome c [Poseidonocella sp. HB161398]|uniref:cytochrome c n=1 Tax=Poseidonocella sp. HB161398 TaxID=2320855 RepID=UPI001108A142|nr:cytochrome c [Poseidonocella sp. HB161398]
MTWRKISGRQRAGRLAAGLAVLAAVAGLGVLAASWRPAIAPVAVPDPASVYPGLVQRGAALAATGDCAVCHTRTGGAAYAGSRPLPTPFGTIYATNITPDPETGIGRWPLSAFRRAMRQGVSRDGHHLYPAMPYTHYARMTDGDLAALYAFLMTRRPVAAEAPANALVFPLNFRPELAGWKLLFLRSGPFVPDPGRSAEWNRGAYLAEGPGHCSACHSPLDRLGGERGGALAYSGGSAEGWTAPPLDGRNPGAARWTAATLETYLRSGASPGHGAAAGPMAPVVRALADAPQGDVRALAVYADWLMHGAAGGAAGPAGPPPPDRAEAAAGAHPRGALLFAGACSGCHDEGAAGLAGTTDLALPGPENALRAIIGGIAPPVDRTGAAMPPFAASLGDGDLAELAAYLRLRFGDGPAWDPARITAAIAAARTEETAE